MMKTIKEITDIFRLEQIRNDRRIIVFMICLLIATALWFLNALSKDYTTTISYSVKYTNPPQNVFLASNPPSQLDLKVNAHGFTLLRHKLSISVSPIVLNLSSIVRNNDYSGKSVTIRSEDLLRRISDQVSSEITVNDVNPKAITFIFDSLQTRKVPVEALVKIGFKPQYFLSGDIIVEPDTVNITGPATIIDTVSRLYTRIFENEELDAPVKTPLTVVIPERTRIDPERVVLSIPVERFTEKTFKIPVEVRDKPDDVNMKVFPSEVTVAFLVGLSDYDQIQNTDFTVFVSYDSISTSDVLEVNLDKIPAFVQQVRISPPNVEYLIETN